MLGLTVDRCFRSARTRESRVRHLPGRTKGPYGGDRYRNLALAGVVVGIALFLLAGCFRSGERFSYVPYQPATELITVHYTVADSLQASLCVGDICELPMLMASFVNLDDLDQTSPLGRIIPQQIGSRFVQHGMNLVDVRMRTQSLLIRKEQGEFALSRELAKINRDVDAHSVLTGTYSVAYGRVYVTAMILRSTDGSLLAALDYFLPVDGKALRHDDAPRTTPPPGPEQLPDPLEGIISPSVLTRL